MGTISPVSDEKNNLQHPDEIPAKPGLSALRIVKQRNEEILDTIETILLIITGNSEDAGKPQPFEKIPSKVFARICAMTGYSYAKGNNVDVLAYRILKKRMVDENDPKKLASILQTMIKIICVKFGIPEPKLEADATPKKVYEELTRFVRLLVVSEREKQIKLVARSKFPEAATLVQKLTEITVPIPSKELESSVPVDFAKLQTPIWEFMRLLMEYLGGLVSVLYDNYVEIAGATTWKSPASIYSENWAAKKEKAGGCGCAMDEGGRGGTGRDELIFINDTRRALAKVVDSIRNIVRAGHASDIAEVSKLIKYLGDELAKKIPDKLDDLTPTSVTTKSIKIQIKTLIAQLKKISIPKIQDDISTIVNEATKILQYLKTFVKTTPARFAFEHTGGAVEVQKERQGIALKLLDSESVIHDSIMDVFNSIDIATGAVKKLSSTVMVEKIEPDSFDKLYLEARKKNAEEIGSILLAKIEQLLLKTTYEECFKKVNPIILSVEANRSRLKIHVENIQIYLKHLRSAIQFCLDAIVLLDVYLKCFTEAVSTTMIHNSFETILQTIKLVTSLIHRVTSGRIRSQLIEMFETGYSAAYRDPNNADMVYLRLAEARETTNYPTDTQLYDPLIKDTHLTDVTLPINLGEGAIQKLLRGAKTICEQLGFAKLMGTLEELAEKLGISAKIEKRLKTMGLVASAPDIIKRINEGIVNSFASFIFDVNEEEIRVRRDPLTQTDESDIRDLVAGQDITYTTEEMVAAESFSEEEIKQFEHATRKKVGGARSKLHPAFNCFNMYWDMNGEFMAPITTLLTRSAMSIIGLLKLIEQTAVSTEHLGHIATPEVVRFRGMLGGAMAKQDIVAEAKKSPDYLRVAYSLYEIIYFYMNTLYNEQGAVVGLTDKGSILKFSLNDKLKESKIILDVGLREIDPIDKNGLLLKLVAAAQGGMMYQYEDQYTEVENNQHIVGTINVQEKMNAITNEIYEAYKPVHVRDILATLMRFLSSRLTIVDKLRFEQIKNTIISKKHPMQELTSKNDEGYVQMIFDSERRNPDLPELKPSANELIKLDVRFSRKAIKNLESLKLTPKQLSEAASELYQKTLSLSTRNFTKSFGDPFAKVIGVLPKDPSYNDIMGVIYSRDHQLYRMPGSDEELLFTSFNELVLVPFASVKNFLSMLYKLELYFKLTPDNLQSTYASLLNTMLQLPCRNINMRTNNLIDVHLLSQEVMAANQKLLASKKWDDFKRECQRLNIPPELAKTLLLLVPSRRFGTMMHFGGTCLGGTGANGAHHARNIDQNSPIYFSPEFDARSGSSWSCRKLYPVCNIMTPVDFEIDADQDDGSEINPFWLGEAVKREETGRMYQYLMDHGLDFAKDMIAKQHDKASADEVMKAIQVQCVNAYDIISTVGKSIANITHFTRNFVLKKDISYEYVSDSFDVRPLADYMKNLLSQITTNINVFRMKLPEHVMSHLLGLKNEKSNEPDLRGSINCSGKQMSWDEIANEVSKFLRSSDESGLQYMMNNFSKLVDGWNQFFQKFNNDHLFDPDLPLTNANPPGCYMCDNLYQRTFANMLLFGDLQNYLVTHSLDADCYWDYRKMPNLEIAHSPSGLAAAPFVEGLMQSVPGAGILQIINNILKSIFINTFDAKKQKMHIVALKLYEEIKNQRAQLLSELENDPGMLAFGTIGIFTKWYNNKQYVFNDVQGAPRLFREEHNTAHVFDNDEYKVPHVAGIIGPARAHNALSNITIDKKGIISMVSDPALARTTGFVPTNGRLSTSLAEYGIVDLKFPTFISTMILSEIIWKHKEFSTTTNYNDLDETLVKNLRTMLPYYRNNIERAMCEIQVFSEMLERIDKVGSEEKWTNIRELYANTKNMLGLIMLTIKDLESIGSSKIFASPEIYNINNDMQLLPSVRQVAVNTVTLVPGGLGSTLNSPPNVHVFYKTALALLAPFYVPTSDPAVEMSLVKLIPEAIKRLNIPIKLEDAQRLMSESARMRLLTENLAIMAADSPLLIRKSQKVYRTLFNLANVRSGDNNLGAIVLPSCCGYGGVNNIIPARPTFRYWMDPQTVEVFDPSIPILEVKGARGQFELSVHRRLNGVCEDILPNNKNFERNLGGAPLHGKLKRDEFSLGDILINQYMRETQLVKSNYLNRLVSVLTSSSLIYNIDRAPAVRILSKYDIDFFPIGYDSYIILPFINYYAEIYKNFIQKQLRECDRTQPCNYVYESMCEPIAPRGERLLFDASTVYPRLFYNIKNHIDVGFGQACLVLHPNEYQSTNAKLFDSHFIRGSMPMIGNYDPKKQPRAANILAKISGEDVTIISGDSSRIYI